MMEGSGGARKESVVAGWGAAKERVKETGYCTRLEEQTLADRVCTAFFWKNDEYTPVIGCMTCKYWQKGELRK